MRSSTESKLGEARATASLAGRSLPAVIFAALTALATTGCPSAATLENARPATAEKWFRRAQQDFQSADVQEARDSVQKALSLVPSDKEVRLLAGRIALARLDYDEALRLLKGIPGSDAAGLRGRALWYKGDLDAAADELDAMLDDPDVVDDWAKGISKLARRGAGRTPFSLSGALLAAVELPHVSPMAPFFVVPVEIDGESALAMISTGNAEVVLDSQTRPEPSWISLRFGSKLEVKDVPALTQDLSGISKQMGVPIRALIGVNLLRHLNATLDYEGRQFVARTFVPPPPPDATRIELFYVRGGGMVLKSSLSGDKGARASLLVDTAMTFPIALDGAGWKKAGVAVSELKPIAEDPDKKLHEGVVSVLRLGAFDVPKVPGVYGAPLEQIEKAISLDIDGVIGAGLLANFRITFGDAGRLMWLEDNAAVLRMLEQRSPVIPQLDPSGGGGQMLDSPTIPLGPEPRLGSPGGASDAESPVKNSPPTKKGESSDGGAGPSRKEKQR